MFEEMTFLPFEFEVCHSQSIKHSSQILEMFFSVLTKDNGCHPHIQNQRGDFLVLHLQSSYIYMAKQFSMVYISSI